MKENPYESKRETPGNHNLERRVCPNTKDRDGVVPNGDICAQNGRSHNMTSIRRLENGEPLEPMEEMDWIVGIFVS